MSQTIETVDLKNISWNEKRKGYIVYIHRFNQVFYKLVYSLEDAIELREKVLEFFKVHKRKPSSEELGLERKKPVFAKRVEKMSLQCKVCNSEIDYHAQKSRDLFIKRDNICGYCHRIKKSNEEVLENPDSMKHITFDKHSNRYIVQIRRFNTAFYHRTENLEDAKSLRNEVIHFYVENNRLPDAEEKNLILNIRPRVKHNFTTESRSNTNEKHISRQEDGVYVVMIFRNCRFFRSVAQTLDRAIEIRDRALEYFDRFGVLPTSKQLIEYLN